MQTALLNERRIIMNNIEHEARILKIDTKTMRAKLKKLGAKKTGDYFFRRYVFDTIPATPNKWARLRSDGHEATLTVKEINSSAISGTSEWEISVSDIDKTLAILEKIGVTPRGYQENIREEYKFENVQITIDTWPKLQPYTEIEAENTTEVLRIARLLGYKESDITTDNTEKIYKSIGIDLKKTARLTFEASK